jgi:phospholipid N-methyltransferase
MVNFLKEYLLKQKTTGAIWPSSSHLAKAMTPAKNLASANDVVELGPGTGAITREIIGKLPGDCTFFAVEINPTFAEVLEKKYPQLRIYRDSAENIKKYLKKNNLKQCDLVISSLPWTYLNPQLQTKIVDTISQSLSPEGKMITYSYLHSALLSPGKRFKQKLNHNFTEVKKKIVWKNIPPAIVYECKK